jgi:membrane protease YdiL (CAAX protease family)
MIKVKADYKTALVGGLTIGLVPTWLVNALVDAFPELKPEELEVVAEFMSGDMDILKLLFFLIIVFIVPPLEELLFRGGLWKLLNWKLSPQWTWIIVSLFFAAIHIEPVHVLGLLPLSFFLGWLRKESNKLGPSILAHMANNAVGCTLMML